jgi:hypothetical protein
MTLRRITFAVVPAATAVLAAACFGSSDNHSTPIGPFDGGGLDTSLSGDDAGGDHPDTGSSPGDGGPGPGTDGGSGDAGAGDDGAVTVSACSAPLRVDSRAGVSGAEAVFAEAFGAKYVVLWAQIPQVSGDNMGHILARAFDGAALGNEIDLGVDVFGQMKTGTDGAGHAFAQWSAPSTMVRTVFDFATLAFSTPAGFGGASPYTATDVASAGPGTGLSLYLQNNGMLAADRWSADAGWVGTGLAFSASNPSELRLLSNAAGKAAAGWYAYPGTEPAYYAMTFDGGGWGPVTSTTPVDAGAPAYANYGILANGDVLYSFEHVDSVQTALYHAATGAWDAPVPVATGTIAQNSAGRYVVVADAADRVTIAWATTVSGIEHTFTSRSFDRGAHWSTPADFGPSNFVILGVDPATSNVVAATYGNGQNSGSGLGNEGIFLRATAPTGTTWSAPAQTNVQTDQGGNYGSLDKSAHLVFTTAGVVVVAHQRDLDAGIAYTVQAVTCHL